MKMRVEEENVATEKGDRRQKREKRVVQTPCCLKCVVYKIWLNMRKRTMNEPARKGTMTKTEA